jgi:hypothetical protein
MSRPNYTEFNYVYKARVDKEYSHDLYRLLAVGLSYFSLDII